MAVALVNYLVAPDDPAFLFDFAPEMERLIRLAERRSAVDAGAHRRGVSRDIPFFRLDAIRSSSSGTASTSSGSGRR
jgi:hypothetical protein